MKLIPNEAIRDFSPTYQNAEVINIDKLRVPEGKLAAPEVYQVGAAWDDLNLYGPNGQPVAKALRNWTGDQYEVQIHLSLQLHPNIQNGYIVTVQNNTPEFIDHTVRESNRHQIHTLKVDNPSYGYNGSFEWIHQNRNGGCGIINFLNTYSFLFGGQVPLSFEETRKLVAQNRIKNGLDMNSPSDINGTPELNLEDMFELFKGLIPEMDIRKHSKYQQLSNHRDVRYTQIQNIIENLPTVTTLDMFNHSVTLIRDGSSWLFLDPAAPRENDVHKPKGPQKLNLGQVVNTLARYYNESSRDRIFRAVFIPVGRSR